MLRDEKILITGPAGRIAYGLARSLVADNDVWGIARFGDPATREKVDALGVTTRAMDFADGDFGDLPTDFTYLLHLDWLETGEVVAWLQEHRPPAMHVVITGRHSPAALVEMADLVTEMREVKHYWKNGVPCRTGIER